MGLIISFLIKCLGLEAELVAAHKEDECVRNKLKDQEKELNRLRNKVNDTEDDLNKKYGK